MAKTTEHRNKEGRSLEKILDASAHEIDPDIIIIVAR
ncbi:capping complex subunit for YIEGIA [Lederbergia citrea]